MGNEASGYPLSRSSVAVTYNVPGPQVSGTFSVPVFAGVNVNTGTGYAPNELKITLPKDASVAGLSLNRSSVAASGLLTATVYGNGAAISGAALTFNGGNMFLSVPFARGTYPLLAGDVVQLGFTSSSFSQASGGLVCASLFLWI